MVNDKIKEGDNSETEIYGYKSSKIKLIATWFLYFCTGFILRLLFHWMPRWYIFFTHTTCSICDADMILLKDQYKQYWIHRVLSALKNVEWCTNSKNTKKCRLDKDYQPEQIFRYFIHKKVKYIWNSETKEFESLHGLEQTPSSEFYTAKPLTNIDVQNRMALYGENNIEVQITPISVLLLKEGLNPFYIFQLCSCVLWFLDDYVIYAGCIVFMSIISLIVKLYEIRKNEKSLRNTVVSSGDALVCRDGKTLTKINAKDLVPGDIVEIPRSRYLMQFDAALISGNCIVNESMLTGESVPVTKTTLPNPMGLIPFMSNAVKVDGGDNMLDFSKEDMSEVLDINKHSKHILFCGTKVIQGRNVENEPVLAVVVRTGYLTAKGELVRSILFPKPIDLKFNQDALKFILVLGLFAIIGFVYTIVVMVSRNVDIVKMVIRSLDIITIIISPALPVAMTIGIVFAQSRLKKKNIFCINPNTINICGGINVACFDKTGTLTEDGLDLWGVVASRIDGSFEDPVSDPTQLPLSPLVENMATCHSLNIIDGEVCGDPLDLKMFQSIKWSFKEGVDGNKNEFQMSVPMIAYRKNDSEKDDEIGILRQFPFSSSLQRMSVITKFSTRANFNIYVKGSPEMISSLCRKETIPRDFNKKLLQFTHEGYRVLALAYRPLKISYSKMMRISRNEVERELRFLGFLIMENRLKPETETVIDELNTAMIRPIMVTGDNMLTAISVARDCGMIAELDKVILVDARLSDTEINDPIIEFHYAEDLQRPVNEISVMNKKRNEGNDKKSCVKVCMIDRPDFHLAMSGKTWGLIREKCPHLIPKLVVKGTVFARFTPDQKTQLIESLQSVGYIVSMCGDGANDCGALKAAHAGISLSEAEASVASPFTSKIQNISCVPELIKEGRCALSTSFGTFKFMAGYSFTQFLSVLILYWFTANLGDFQFLYIDMVIITTLGVTYGYSKACKKLSVEAPSVRLLTPSMISSLVLHWICNALFQIGAYFFVASQSWYTLPIPSSPSDVIHSSHANTAIFSVSVFQYAILAFVFSKGRPFRSPIYRNYIFITNLVVAIALSAYIVFKPFIWLQKLLDLVSFPTLWINVILISSVVVNFVISYIIEIIIDNMSLRRQMKRIKLLLFPQYVDQTEYERIREEINNSNAQWPPLIKCASVQDMRPEIFTDSSVLHSSQSIHELGNVKVIHKDIDILKEESEDEEIMLE